MNAVVLMIVLCMACSLSNKVSVACAQDRNAFGGLCAKSFGLIGAVLSLACCSVLIASPFRARF